MKKPLEVFQHFKTLGNVPTKLIDTCKEIIVLFTRSHGFLREESLKIRKSLAMSTDHMGLWYNLGLALALSCVQIEYLTGFFDYQNVK